MNKSSYSISYCCDLWFFKDLIIPSQYDTSIFVLLLQFLHDSNFQPHFVQYHILLHYHFPNSVYLSKFVLFHSNSNSIFPFFEYFKYILIIILLYSSHTIYMVLTLGLPQNLYYHVCEKTINGINISINGKRRENERAILIWRFLFHDIERFEKLGNILRQWFLILMPFV
ncbi:hypothetical protein SAY86_000353 [Trapa natans]|uniref:Uncharacterized protein n=1 Tax=Trapa natans TaxID=22666 RepID=A0AAN7MU76_TRANT|nr:hypothetical protein SAY86_000353 [Trapa natans]